MEATFFPWLFIIKPYLTYQYGGMELVCWSIAVPMVAGWHSTFLVNSAAHMWGRQPYDTGEFARARSVVCSWGEEHTCRLARHAQFLCAVTPPPLTQRMCRCAGDLSTNCWWVAALSFGEGWHNAHHAFPYSARHGLEWWELDPTWYLICILKAIGLVWDVQVSCRVGWASEAGLWAP
jgi:stearoyl-CoA desaturase (delta-9 desaturase)